MKIEKDLYPEDISKDSKQLEHQIPKLLNSQLPKGYSINEFGEIIR